MNILVVFIFMAMIASMYVAFGGFFLWRYKGDWVLATLEPQICWRPGREINGLSKAIHTEWNKFENNSIWYKKL